MGARFHCNLPGDPSRWVWALWGALLFATGAGCDAERAHAPTTGYDPLAYAEARLGKVGNLEASVPPQCYTRTDGVSNPCWTCHTQTHGMNAMADAKLQREYAFSEFALKNHWSNLFEPVRAKERETDASILAYVREDNYAPLVRALAGRQDFPGYKPDLDYARGFDELGFALDDSAWRSLRYKPFPGTFWPMNGSADDVFVRLPEQFRKDAGGELSRDVYRANLSVLEASLASDPARPNSALDYPIEPLDERTLDYDMDGDGQIAGVVSKLHALPSHYFGAARAVKVRRGLYPNGTEFLHSVRYLDPELPGFMAKRMKELRYMKKTRELDTWAVMRAYEEEHDKRDRGALPVYPGNALVGLRNEFGWQLQGFIEDAYGRLRLQTDEEHRYCMGCHSGLGVTVDQTFAFVRKLPGAAGWSPQDLRGISDAPQLGHAEGEIGTYLRRVGGGDEFRANREALARFFRAGRLVEPEVQSKEHDITELILPSRERALDLDRAYRALVRAQAFDRGRDALIGRVQNVHPEIVNGSTELGATGRVFDDGQLRLDWSGEAQVR
ncbi:MAG: hypothetical protein R3B89_12345 [Polyangiaceae bacterium]